MSRAGSRFRQGIMLASRGSNTLLIRQGVCGSRSLSTVFSMNHRPLLPQLVTSRNFSLWPSTKTTPPTTPASTPSPEIPVETTNTAASAPVDLSTNATATIETSTIAEIPLTPESEIASDSATTVADLLQNIPQTLQYGDLAALGLAGWSPAGIVRWSLEVINVASGLPWFWTIVVGSAFWRLVCVPLTVKAAKTSAIIQPNQAEMSALQERVKLASHSRNPAALAKANREFKDFYKRLGISPFSGLVGFLQLPVTFGVFFGVKKLCDFPVEQLKFSGLEMFPDLTVADPTLILPIAMTVAVNVQLLAGSRDVNKAMRPLMYGFHFLTIPGFFILKGLPTGLILSLLTTAILTTFQTLAMRIPKLRGALGMPAYVPPPPSQAGKSLFSELRTRLSKDGDVKDKVAKARRQALRKNMHKTL